MILSRTRREKRLFESAVRAGTPQRYWQDFNRGLKEGQIHLADYSIKELFESFVPDGREIVDSWNPRHGGHGIMLAEAGDAVTTSDFSNITGQLAFTQVLDAFSDPGFLYPQLVNDIQTSFDGEKIPGIGRIGDEAATIGEAQPYPLAGVGEEFIETPSTIKTGMIVPVTKEAIFFDRTGRLVQRASEVGYWLGQNKEKRVLDEVLGITNSYKYNGVADNTYADDSGTHNWDNLQASNALVDWTDVENALLLFDGMTDPVTGEPIMIIPNTIIVPTALKKTVERVLHATSIQFGSPGSTSDVTLTNAANPINEQLALITGSMVKSRTSSASTWFIGDFKRAFQYMQNWPITSVQAPTNSHDEFHRDIVQQYKVSERGVPATVNPRYVVKSTA